MKIGALVPARIGSKRLPKKNIKILGDKPLICWTIDVLLEADVFYDITVSTESDEIADVVRQYYSEKEVNILKRPEELAQDDSPLREVIYHYLENRKDLDWYGVFLPTFPFRKVEKILEAWNVILTREVWTIESVTERLYSSRDFFFPTSEGLKFFFKGPPFYCRYGVPVYELNHITYRKELWPIYGLTQAERRYFLTLSLEETLDIDTIEDFNLAQNMILNKRKHRLRLKEYNISNEWWLISPDNVEVNKILEVCKSYLDDSKSLLLIVTDKILPVSFLLLNENSWRDYFVDSEARNKVINEMVLKTQNMTYFNNQYRHSSLFRFINKRRFDERRFFSKESVKIENGIIPWDRVIFEKDLLQQVNKNRFDYEQGLF